MNRRTLWGLSALAFLALLLWGPALSVMFDLVAPDADPLTVYLVNKGLFAVALLVVLAKWDGLRGYGFERGRSWWFLLPGAPFLVLTPLVALNPESPFGLGVAAVFVVPPSAPDSVPVTVGGNQQETTDPAPNDCAQAID